LETVQCELNNIQLIFGYHLAISISCIQKDIRENSYTSSILRGHAEVE